MNKNILAGLIALLIILGAGIAEVVVVAGKYKELENQCQTLIDKAEEGQITMDEYDEFCQKWDKLRVLSELLLPHNDVYEVNIRIAEVKGYLGSGAYEDAITQLEVIKVLLAYIPDNVIPDFHHIV